jgi:hypothetical protein
MARASANAQGVLRPSLLCSVRSSTRSSPRVSPREGLQRGRRRRLSLSSPSPVVDDPSHRCNGGKEREREGPKPECTAPPRQSRGTRQKKKKEAAPPPGWLSDPLARAGASTRANKRASEKRELRESLWPCAVRTTWRAAGGPCPDGSSFCAPAECACACVRAGSGFLFSSLGSPPRVWLPT